MRILPKRRILRIACLLFFGLLAMLAALSAFCVWLLTTTGGLEFSLRLAAYASDDRLQASGASGRLLGPFRLARLTWAEDAPITLSDVEIDWSPAELQNGVLAIARARVARLEIAPRPADAPEPPPERLTLPFSLMLTQLEIAQLDYGRTPLARNIVARATSDGRTHTFAARFSRDDLNFDLTGQLSGEGDLPLSATLAIDAAATLAGKRHALTLRLLADGPLAALPITGELQDDAGGGGHFSATLTPFAAQPITALQARIQDFDPSHWLPSLPQAKLDILADAALQDRQLSGQFELRNKLRGKLHNKPSGAPDARALPFLPLEAARGNFVWRDDETLEFPHLDIRFPGQGRYQGRLAFKRPTLDIEGEATHIDPRHFMRQQLPAGQFAARFHLLLNLDEQQGQHALQLDFTLPPSALAGQTLQGQGHLRYAAARFHNVDIDLRLGPNHARLKGALGAAKDALEVAITAPRLEIPPFVGDLEARLTLSTPAGHLGAPFIKGSASSNRLALPDDITLQDLRLQSDFNLQALFGATHNQDFSFTLSLAQLKSRAGELRAGALALSGRPDAHRLTLEADLAAPSAGAGHLRLALSGGLAGAHSTSHNTSRTTSQNTPRNAQHNTSQNAPHNTLQHWRGALEQLQFESPGDANNPAARITLTAPAALTVDTRRFTLEQASLQGNVGGAPWLASLEGLVYPFEAEAPLQGELRLQSDNLAWAAALIGPGYRTGGRLKAELKLAGVNTAPRWQGFIHADALTFLAPDLGLRLESGQLRLAFDERVLRLESFQFTNPRAPLPQKLDRDQRESLRPLAEAPGHIRGQGFLRLTEEATATAPDDIADGQLEFHLEKLGVMQKPEQWLALSGTGRLQLGAQQAKRRRLNLDAKLNVDGGYWRLADMGAPQLSDDVIVTRAAPDGRAPSEGATSLHTNLAVDIDLGSKLYFVGAGVYSRLRGALRIQGARGEPPRATGSIRVADGRFDAYGQRLEIEQGTLTFNGLVQNPVLNIRALRKQQAVEAGVSITGTAQKPVIRLISEPNVPDAEKLSWLVLGEAPDEQSGADYAALLTAAQAILGGQEDGPGSALADLQRALGVNISMGKAGQRQAPASQVAQSGGFGGNHIDNSAQVQVVRIGTRLADGLTLSYEQSLAGTESVLKLTYALTRRLSLVGQTGSDNALDLFYNFQFGRRKPDISRQDAESP
jgi:translocation and assembly module TamB